MNIKTDKVKLGWYIPAVCRNQFSQWCADNGLVCQEDCAGALIIWPYLPAAIRERAKAVAKGIDSVDENFWGRFRVNLERALQPQPNNQQKESSETKPQGVRDALMQLKKIAAETPPETIRLLSPGERKLVDKVRDELGPEQKKKTTAKKIGGA